MQKQPEHRERPQTGQSLVPWSSLTACDFHRSTHLQKAVEALAMRWHPKHNTKKAKSDNTKWANWPLPKKN